MSIVPVRLQLCRAQGWRLQRVSRRANSLDGVNVARPSMWGNPFRVGDVVDLRQARKWGWAIGFPGRVCADRAEAAARFARSLWRDEASHQLVQDELRGKNLFCWCFLCERHATGKPLGDGCQHCSPCHADPLGEVANR